MNELSKISRIKVYIILLYLLSFTLPIYSQVLFGTKYKISILGLGGGTFFILFFFVLAVASTVTEFVYKEYYKYTYFGTLGFMTLFSLFLVIFKDPLSSIRMTYFIQVLMILILTAAYFFEEQVVQLFDELVLIIKSSSSKLYQFIKKKMNDSKSKHDEAKEGNDNE